MRYRQSALHCFVPPILLEQIARNGNAAQRARALQTMSFDQSIRAARLQNVLRGARAPRRADVMTLVPAGQPRRTIYSAGNREDLPGTLIRSEGGAATGDPAVDEAYDGLGATYALYWDAYERNSIDDEGMPLDGIVHYGRDYDNAFWDGRRMIFGDGDGQLFLRFTIAVDVIGHELTHGVTEDEAQLYYWQQPGALNESASDVFGSLVKQFGLKQNVDQADWLIGAGLLGPQVNGTALRSMKAPGTAYDDPVLGKDPQPAHMRDYVHTLSDNGGVHINSGIPNHAFYLAATKLGGYAWERAGSVWYETLRDSRLKPTAQFRTFARITAANARRLYGAGSDEESAIKEGWAEVGISI